MPPRPTDARQAEPTRAEVGQLAGELYEANRIRLRAYLRLILGSIADDVFDDLIQDALLAFIRSYRRDPRDRKGALRYLIVCVRTAASRYRRTYTRKRGPLVAFHESEDSPSRDGVMRLGTCDPEEIALERDAHAERLRRVAELPASERACLILRAYGLSTAEIIAELGISERQLRKRVENAHRRLGEGDGVAR